MKILDELFSGLIIKNYTKKGNVIIAKINDSKVSIKKKSKEIKDIYSYLESRNFDYFPKLILDNDYYYVHEYIDEIVYSKEEKALDFMNILSLLHSKTTYYKEMDVFEYKTIYENNLNKINDTKIFYERLIDNIEKHIFMSPFEYLLARNISKIMSSLEYSEKTLNKWYDLIKEDAKKRVVLLYNNIDINHLIKNKDIYLINWDKSEFGLPIYDLFIFFKKYDMNFDFITLFNAYESKYPLKEEEKLLFYVIISIPDIIKFSDKELDNTKNMKKIIDFLYKSEVFIDKTNTNP